MTDLEAGEIVPPEPAVAEMVYVFKVNVAVHALAAFMVTEPSEQSASPLQPVNVEPTLGELVSVTTCP